jgi:plastocyanin
MRAALTALLYAATLPAAGAGLDLSVKDAAGAPVAGAVAYALPKPGPAPSRPRRDVKIEQKDKVFVPFVTVVQAGSSIEFPNRDAVRHHVYSFSPAKNFEIKLYAGTPAAPIVFDKPGEVVLGCNIHDNMLAFVLVVETPWFAKTGADGRARIDALPAGDYEVVVWHPLQAGAQAPRAVKLAGDDHQASEWNLALRPTPPGRR